MSKKNIRILAVDDDALDLMILQRYLDRLEQWDTTFLPLTNGNEVWQTLSMQPVDLLFLDYRLGAVKSTEIIGRLHREWETLPVIVLTGHDEPEVSEEILHAGAQYCIPKQQLSVDVLQAVFSHMLGP
ncbi:MAG: response regulator [Candidatus Hydrogenedentes bacterium]|nr:response regulator [Candidatus Hydrogenedentota bacterium]